MSSKLYSISSDEELPVVYDFNVSQYFMFQLGHLFVVFSIMNTVPNMRVFVRSLHSLYTELISQHVFGPFQVHQYLS